MAGVSFDFLIIGSGAGGGTVAGSLAKSGAKVLIVERGPDPDFSGIGRDHLRNQRLSRYGCNAGPDSPHVREDGATGRIVLPHDPAYHANAAVLGGGTRVYGAQAWRFHPLDFKMASTYGVPAGSSLADWPIDYEEMAPWYTQAEQTIGVCGDASTDTHLPAPRPAYPMPPLPVGVQGIAMRRAAKDLGWTVTTVPLAINSIERDGRPACIGCQHCVGFACPVDAKNGARNTLVAQGLASGNLTIRTGVSALRLHHSFGTVTGVDIAHPKGTETVSAHHVIVCAGAIETARLLLSSGIGGDMVGRNLQGHVYTGAIGLLQEAVRDGTGPGVSTATCRWNHGNDGVIGGGMLADEFVPLPIVAWKRCTPPELARHGIAAKRWMIDNYRRLIEIKGPVQDIPSPNARVTLSTHRDLHGMPIVKLDGATHTETIRSARFLHRKARVWLSACGATAMWGEAPVRPFLSGGQHQAGTCRMGDSPKDSVVDRNQRVHGFENLHIGDTSVHVTNGGFNPVLTVFALSLRLAHHLASI